MADRIGTTDQPRAAVVAGDGAVRASLVMLLELCGLEPSAFARPEDLLDNSPLNEELVFVDCCPSGCSGIAAIKELRRRDWQGTAVIMTEREPPPDWLAPEGPIKLLVKPFSADDVLAIVQS